MLKILFCAKVIVISPIKTREQVILLKQPPQNTRRTGRVIKRLLIFFTVLLIILAALLATLYFLVDRYMSGLPDLQQVLPPESSQILIFPLDSGFITTGYRNPAYFSTMGFSHFGLDLVPPGGGHTYVISSGEGIVLGTEFREGSLGYIAVIRYDDVFVPKTGEVISLIARYYHMASLAVARGDILSPSQIIGSIYGGHEFYGHIHIELDANIDFPFHTPQVAEASSDLLYRYGATGEHMINPLYVLTVGPEQWIFLHPNSRYTTENDHPRFMLERGQPWFFAFLPRFIL